MNLEPIYDEQINPLMAQIIAICKEHNIPLIASFQLTDQAYEDEQGSDEGPLMCTTIMLPEEVDVDDRMENARDAILETNEYTFSLTIRGK